MNEANDSKFVTRKRNIVTDQSNANYDVGNESIYNTEALKPNLFYYDDAYIYVKGDITVTATPTTQVSLKNCASFTKCITKIDVTTVDDAEDLHLFTAMYNLIECSSNYSETTGSLWFYFNDDATNSDFNIANNDTFTSFKYEARWLGNTVAQPVPNQANGILKNATITVPLKYFK